MSDLYNQLMNNTPTLQGQVEYFEPSLNDAAIDETWKYLIPSGIGLRGLGVGALNALNIFKRMENIKTLAEKRKAWGIPFRKASGNPQKAIEVLKENEKGFVPNAYKDVDFVWGEYTPPVRPKAKGKGFGLYHIKGRRNEQGYDGDKFLDEIPDLFDSGTEYNKFNHNGRYYIGNGTKEGVIRTDYDGKPWKWLNSVYYLE